VWLAGQGQYGINHRFQIRGFLSGGYAYILDAKHTRWWHHVAPWAGYIPHQILALVLLGYVQSKSPKYSHRFRWFNWAFLLLNGFFIMLKYTQTSLTYNGLSMHLSLGWGVGTVAIYLCVVSCMYITTRGVCFGRCKRCKFWFKPSLFFKKYHGYYICFAIINDFWYHPFESTPGHLTGILNDLLLLWQMTGIYTHGHRNKYWCLMVECLVLPHSAFIAIDRGTGSSGTFGFGYFLVLVVTQQFLIPMHLAFRILLGVLFLLSCGLTFGLKLQYDCTKCEAIGFGKIWTISWIPMLSYIMAFVAMPALFWLSYLFISRLKNKTGKAVASAIALVLCGAVCFLPYFGLFANFGGGGTSSNYTNAELLGMKLNATRCPDIRCMGYENFTREVPREIDELFS